MSYPPAPHDALANEEAGEALMTGNSAGGHGEPDEEEEIIDEVRSVPTIPLISSS